MTLTFDMVMSILAAEMGDVLLKCDQSRIFLDRLDSLLIVLHEILTRELAAVNTERDDLLAALWSYLGGNKYLDLQGKQPKSLRVRFGLTSVSTRPTEDNSKLANMTHRHA